MVLPRKLKQQHEPARGKLREVYIAVREKGQQIDPVDQVLHVEGGYQALVTITTADEGNWVITLNGTNITYPASGSDTALTICKKLLALVNQVENVRSTGVFGGNEAGSGPYTFELISSKTFTAAITVPGTGVGTVGPVSSVAGGVAKGATSITLFEPLEGPIMPGQYLVFADADDLERLVEVTAKADAGATSLTIAPAAQAITGGSRAEYPPYLWDRTAADIDRSYSVSSTTTFNTGDDRDGVAQGSEKNLSLPGLDYYYNAAYQTALKAANEGAYIHVRVVDPPPNSSFSKGRTLEGRALVTSAPSAAPQDDAITSDLEIAFMGATTETAPVPV